MRVERDFDDRPVETVEPEPVQFSLARLFQAVRGFFFPDLDGQVVTQVGPRPSP